MTLVVMTVIEGGGGSEVTQIKTGHDGDMGGDDAFSDGYNTGWW